MSPLPHLDLIILAACLVFALVLPALGIMRLLGVAKALRARVEAYAELPIVVYANRASRKIDAGSNAIARAPALIDRAQAAQRDTINSFAKIRTMLASPVALWRLGAYLITGE